MNKKITLIVICLILVLGGVSLVKNKNTKNQEPIKLGFVGPLTGDASSYGEPTKAGVEIAVEKINQAGGINGRMIEVIYEDGKCSGKDATAAAQKLLSVDKVKFIIGGVCSSETLAIAPLTEPLKAILFSPVSSSSKVTTAGDYVFRNQASDLYIGDVLAKKIIESHKTVAIISESTDYAQSIEKVFSEVYKSSGGQIVFNETFQSGVKDFKSEALKIISTNPEAIYINAQSSSSFIQIMKSLKINNNTAQVYSVFLSGPEVLETGDLVEGVIIADLPNLANSQEVKDLLAKHQEKYGKAPSYPNFTGTGYDAIQIISKGIEKYGEDTSKIKDYIYTIKNYKGTAGEYSFDENGDIQGIEYLFRKIESGKLINL